MALTPLNDLAKIQLDDLGAFSAQSGDTATNGILVAVPEQLHYFGFWSFAFEDSFMNAPELGELLQYWQSQVGKRVYWTALSEKGNILQEADGNRYAYVKFTSLIAASDADEKAESVLDSKGGAFSA